MKTAEHKYSFEEMFTDWRRKNEEQCKSYIDEFTIVEENKIENHPWYKKRVEPLPAFRYRLPGDISEFDFDWGLLLKLLESSESYHLKIRFDDIKLVCRNGHYPSITVGMYGLDKTIYLMNSKEVTDLFYDLIDENIKRVRRTLSNYQEKSDYEDISKYQRHYWQFVAEKINTKLKVSEIFSGNEEIMKYIAE